MKILAKFANFENFILIILQWLTQIKWYIEATMLIFNNKLQKNRSLKNSFIWKNAKD
jgi:hypothetical protein